LLTGEESLETMKEETEGKKRKRKRIETYNTYIYKTLKKTQQKMSISYKAMSIMNSFMKDMFEQIATEAAKIKQNNKRPRLTAREIQSAVKIVLPKQLSRYAVKR